jgi:hypothetical protein
MGSADEMGVVAAEICVVFGAIGVVAAVSDAINLVSAAIGIVATEADVPDHIVRPLFDW